MKKLGMLFIGLTFSGIIALSAHAQEGKMFDFKNETYGAESKSFGSVVGSWRIDRDGNNSVYAAEGREQGPEFPLSIFKGVEDFRNGTIQVSFKPISGKIDQAAGIAFNIKANGDYLVIRANALEDNLVLFRMEQGKRSPLHWVKNVPTPTGQWHTLKVAVSGNAIEGFLDGKKYFDYVYKGKIEGKIGLWSKADSNVFFDKFTVTTQ